MAYFDMPPLSERPIKYLDVQKIYARMNGVRNQISLETAVDALGIVKDVPFHRAFSDAYYTSKILALIPAQIINSVYAYDLYSLPVEDKEELHIRDEDSYTYYSRRYEAKEDILKKQKILAVKCPVCGATLKRKIKWFGHAGRPLHSGAVCPEHGYVAGVLKIRQGETGGYFAEKNVKLVTEEEFNELKERRDKNERALGTLDATHKVPRNPGLPREEHRGFPAPPPLSPFSPPDLDRRVDSPALSGRGSRPSGPTSG